MLNPVWSSIATFLLGTQLVLNLNLPMSAPGIDPECNCAETCDLKELRAFDDTSDSSLPHWGIGCAVGLSVVSFLVGRRSVRTVSVVTIANAGRPGGKAIIHTASTDGWNEIVGRKRGGLASGRWF